jgi:phospholipid/cholesterol/gamma-HCH transport system permease protein
MQSTGHGVRREHWTARGLRIETSAGRTGRHAMPANGTSATPAAAFSSMLQWLGELAIFCARLARAAVTPPYEGRELWRQMDEIGAKSLPLVALSGAAIGVVLSLHTHDSLLRFGAKSLLPSLIILSVIRESGPIITALVVSGRVGAGIGAELGSMKVTEQIDAMEASAVDPLKLLVATRVAACGLMLPLLAIVADACAILTGWLTNRLVDPMSFGYYLGNGFEWVTFGDLLPSAAKTMVFGLLIGVVGCFQGLRATGGTGGVGRSATSAVVISSLFVILADVLLAKIIMILFG